tara:strand:- start:69 stop:218 length:150 start_codon:yes stop_codon:yes gene_type:complete
MSTTEADKKRNEQQKKQKDMLYKRDKSKRQGLSGSKSSVGKRNTLGDYK